MKAGKHVYCEKPMSHTIHEGRAMENTKKYNRVLQTGSMHVQELILERPVNWFVMDILVK